MSTLFLLENVQKSYAGHLALDKVSLRINEGDIFGIIGRSGAGKSTLLRCLAGLEQPTAGTLFFHGHDLATLSKKELHLFRRQIGMIFQDFCLFDAMTVSENIAYPLRIAGESSVDRPVTEMLTFVGLEHKRGIYPAQLSGGEKQRVAIARALIHQPKVLLCDEMTSALDPVTIKEMLALLKRVHREFYVTIIMITHQMGIVREICSQVAVLEEGRLLEAGGTAELLAAPQQVRTREFLQWTVT
jgi:D-methionine transport system ATP-binding protein